MSNKPQLLRIDHHLKSIRLRRTEGYVKVPVIVENVSDVTLYDDRAPVTLRDTVQNVSFVLEGGATVQRYFEVLPAFRYETELLFERVVRPDTIDTDGARKLLPGERSVMMLYLKAREYTPSGSHTIEVHLANPQTKQPLPGGKISLAVEVLPTTVEDERTVEMNEVGEVDFSRHTSAYQTFQDDPEVQTAVVMAVWKRIENLERLIASISESDGGPYLLVLWVNNRAIDRQVIDVLERYDHLPIKAYFSISNIGGFGRFYAAQRLSSSVARVVFMDDDHLFGANTITTLEMELEKSNEKALYGWYAHRFLVQNDYWLRDVVQPGEQVDYIGTCGMITPVKIFTDSRLYDCPRRYWFIEDLWLSYFVQQTYGWSLYKSESQVTPIPDDRDQFWGIIDLKNDFLRWLVKRGYVLVKDRKTSHKKHP